MKHFFILLAFLAIFWFRQSLEPKKYKVEFKNQLQFNSNQLHAVIAEVWNINN